MRDVSRGGLILEALDVAVEPVKLIMAAIGLLVTVVVAVAIFVLGIIVDSMTPDFSPTAFFLRVLAVLVFWALSGLIVGAVTRMSYAELTSDVSASWRAALRYSVEHWAANLFGPFVLAIGVAIIVGVEAIVFGFARIPFLGELIFAVLFLPIALLNILLFVLLIFGSILLYPAVAVDGYGLATAPPKVISLVRHHLGSVVATMLVAAGVAFLATVLVVAVVTGAILLTAGISTVGMGPDKTAEILGPTFQSISQGPQGLVLSFVAAVGVEASTPTVIVARLVVSLAILMLFAAVYALPATFMLATACTLYLSHEAPSAPREDHARAQTAVAPQAAPRVPDLRPPSVADGQSPPERRGGADPPVGDPEPAASPAEPAGSGPAPPSDWIAPTR